MNKLKVYDILLQDDDIGLTAISFVDEPAIEQDFVFFNKQQLMLQIKDKQEVVSPVLIPNQLIYRVNPQTKEEFYIRWSAQTIEQVAVKYILDQATNNTTIMHPTFYDKSLSLQDCLVDDVYMKHMWIIENEKTDKANTKYGFDLPKGTLMVHYKIHNKGLWQRIKSGELKGMSIEAFMSMKPITQGKNNKTNTQTNMNKHNNSIIQKLNQAFGKMILALNDVTDEADAIVDVAENDNTDSGEVTLAYTLDSGDVVTVDAEGTVRDANLEPLEEGTYLLDDGNYLVVDENSKMVETSEKELTADEAKGEEAPIAEKKATKVKQSRIKKAIKQEDESVADAPIVFVVTIDGIDYEVPEPVFDYIHELEAKTSASDVEVEQFKVKVNKFKSELAQLKSRIPSAQPVSTVQSKNTKAPVIETVEDAIIANLKNKWS